MLPTNPERAFDIPCATSSRSRLKSSSFTLKPRDGTLIGTCKIPKKVRERIDGIVSAIASQSTSLKSIPVSCFPKDKTRRRIEHTV